LKVLSRHIRPPSETCENEAKAKAMPSTTNYGTTGDAYLNGVLSGIKWAPTSLTFSFPTSGTFYGAGYSQDNEPASFEPTNGTQQAAVRAVLASYAAVSNLTFSEVTETSSVHGDLRFGESNAPSTAWAYYPSTASAGGDTWFNKTNYNNPVKGNYAYDTITHEVGHAIGLKHPHETSGFFGATFAAMPIDKDFMAYTVMSYRSYQGQSTSGGYTNGSWDFPQSPMMYDIAP
jgi:serralysin